MGRGPACNDELWDFTTETEEIVLSSSESQAAQCLCRAARHSCLCLIIACVTGLHRTAPGGNLSVVSGALSALKQTDPPVVDSVQYLSQVKWYLAAVALSLQNRALAMLAAWQLDHMLYCASSSSQCMGLTVKTASVDVLPPKCSPRTNSL